MRLKLDWSKDSEKDRKKDKDKYKYKYQGWKSMKKREKGALKRN